MNDKPAITLEQLAERTSQHCVDLRPLAEGWLAENAIGPAYDDPHDAGA